MMDGWIVPSSEDTRNESKDSMIRPSMCLPNETSWLIETISLIDTARNNSVRIRTHWRLYSDLSSDLDTKSSATIWQNWCNDGMSCRMSCVTCTGVSVHVCVSLLPYAACWFSALFAFSQYLHLCALLSFCALLCANWAVYASCSVCLCVHVS